MRGVARGLGKVTTFVLLSGCSKAEPLQGTAPPEQSVQSSSVGTYAKFIGRVQFRRPLLDLPKERLSERVDGAEVKLRRLGCRRLRVWRITELSADLELYDFVTEQGAAKLLAEDAGTDRSTTVPGDEGWLGSNVLYFRRKSTLVRLIADVATRPEALLIAARNVDQALATGEVVP